MNKMKAVFVVLILSVIATAQEPAPSPCSKEDLRATMAEALLAAERLKVEIIAARQDGLAKELGQQKSRHEKTEQQLVAEQKTSTSIAEVLRITEKRIAEMERTITAQGKTIAFITEERDKARTWRASFARVFGVGKK